MISSEFGEEIDAILQYEQHRFEAAKTEAEPHADL